MNFNWDTGETRQIAVGGKFKGIRLKAQRPDTIEFSSQDLYELLNGQHTISYLVNIMSALKSKEQRERAITCPSKQSDQPTQR